jgi:hypothetical protein
MKTLLILSMILLTTAGCATKFYLPGNRFITPESSGGLWKGEVKLGALGVTDVNIANDMTSTSPNLTPAMNKNSTMSLGGQLGLHERLDFYLNSVMGGPNYAGVKVQLLGDAATTAKADNFSLALVGGGAFSNTRLTASNGDIQGESTLKYSGWEAMVLLGYRPSDSFLLYAGPFQSVVNADVAIKRTQGGTTTVTGEPDGNGEMRGITGGLRFGQNFFLNLEVTATETVWTREQPSRLATDKFSDTAFGAAIGGAW